MIRWPSVTFLGLLMLPLPFFTRGIGSIGPRSALAAASSVADPALTHLLSELEAVRRRPSSPEAQTEEARLLYYLASFSEPQEKRLALFHRGLNLAEAARKGAPDSMSALHWWAAYQGRIAEIERGVSSLNKVVQIRDVLFKMRKTDPTFLYGAADRALGVLYHKAPSFISIGSSSRAREHFTAALELSPAFPGNLAFFADFLLEEGELDKAEKLVRDVLASKFQPLEDYERKFWMDLGRQILRRVQEKRAS